MGQKSKRFQLQTCRCNFCLVQFIFFARIVSKNSSHLWLEPLRDPDRQNRSCTQLACCQPGEGIPNKWPQDLSWKARFGHFKQDGRSSDPFGSRLDPSSMTFYWSCPHQPGQPPLELQEKDLILVLVLVVLLVLVLVWVPVLVLSQVVVLVLVLVRA